MQNKQGPIFAWERQTRCVASMRGTGIRLGPSTTHPFLPRSPHAMQKGHALAPHTGYLEVHGVTFQGHVARHIRYIGHRVKLETNGGGGASDSVWNILKDILGVRPMTERNCTLTFKFCPERCVCVHTRARTHITTTKSPLRSCSPPQRDCCPFEAPTLLLRGPDPALQGLGHCSSLRPGGEDRATVQSSPCGRSTAPSALPVGAAVKPRLTLRRVWSVPFLAQSS